MHIQHTIEYWLAQIETEGLEAVLIKRTVSDERKKNAIDAAVDLYKTKQADSRSDRRDQREEETLRIAKHANVISWTSALFAFFSLVLAGIAIFLSMT